MADLMKLQNGSDIRGVALEGVEGESVNLTPQICKQIGCAFVSWLEKKTGIPAYELRIGVGRDSRISGPDLANGVIEGMLSAGATVINCGMATTPAMFMSIVFPETSFNGSAMITASHLPFNRNGIKFFDADGGLEHEDITEVLTLAGMLNPAPNNYAAKVFDLLPLYANHLKETIQGALGGAEKPLEGLHIVVDSGNGASGFFVDKILQPLGANTEGSQFLEPDGMFPNHIPNPENKEAMEAIREAVLENKADVAARLDESLCEIGNFVRVAAPYGCNGDVEKFVRKEVTGEDGVLINIGVVFLVPHLVSGNFVDNAIHMTALVDREDAEAVAVVIVAAVSFFYSCGGFEFFVYGLRGGRIVSLVLIVIVFVFVAPDECECQADHKNGKDQRDDSFCCHIQTSESGFF